MRFTPFSVIGLAAATFVGGFAATAAACMVADFVARRLTGRNQ